MIKKTSRLQSFNEFKKIHESFNPMASEYEDDLVTNDINDEDEGSDEEISNSNDDELIEDDIKDDTSETEDDEDTILKDKIQKIVGDNYRDSLKDIFNGVINSLGDEDGGDAIDTDDVIDYLLDATEKFLEEFKNEPADEEDDTEGEGEGEGEAEGEGEDGSEDEAEGGSEDEATSTDEELI